MSKRAIQICWLFLMLAVAGWATGPYLRALTLRRAPVAAPACHAAAVNALALKAAQQDVPADCEKVKDKPKCSRKTGCKCELRCDENGRRLNEDGECKVYCCPSRCECHPQGCCP